MPIFLYILSIISIYYRYFQIMIILMFQGLSLGLMIRALAFIIRLRLSFMTQKGAIEFEVRVQVWKLLHRV